VAVSAIGRTTPMRRRGGGRGGRSAPSSPRVRGLREVVEEKLGECWSPQQISGWLGRTYADEPGMRVSHETIYLSLFVQTRGALGRELCAQLRSGRRTRQPAGSSPQGQVRVREMLMISERPAEVEDRAVRHRQTANMKTARIRLLPPHARWLGPAPALGRLIRVSSRGWSATPGSHITAASGWPCCDRPSPSPAISSACRGRRRFAACGLCCAPRSCGRRSPTTTRQGAAPDRTLLHTRQGAIRRAVRPRHSCNPRVGVVARSPREPAFRPWQQ
jgi:hypothetical protein